MVLFTLNEQSGKNFHDNVEEINKESLFYSLRVLFFFFQLGFSIMTIIVKIGQKYVSHLKDVEKNDSIKQKNNYMKYFKLKCCNLVSVYIKNELDKIIKEKSINLEEILSKYQRKLEFEENVDNFLKKLGEKQKENIIIEVKEEINRIQANIDETNGEINEIQLTTPGLPLWDKYISKFLEEIEIKIEEEYSQTVKNQCKNFCDFFISLETEEYKKKRHKVQINQLNLKIQNAILILAKTYNNRSKKRSKKFLKIFTPTKKYRMRRILINIEVFLWILPLVFSILLYLSIIKGKLIVALRVAAIINISTIFLFFFHGILRILTMHFMFFYEISSIIKSSTLKGWIGISHIACIRVFKCCVIGIITISYSSITFPLLLIFLPIIRAEKQEMILFLVLYSTRVFLLQFLYFLFYYEWIYIFLNV